MRAFRKSSGRSRLLPQVPSQHRPKAVQTEPLESRVLLAGTGLQQRIWNDINPTTLEAVGAPAVDQVDPIVDDDYADGSPAPGIDPDTFAIEWVGEIQAQEAKPYDISVIASDGVRLFLNDVLVINAWRGQGGVEQFAGPKPTPQGSRIKVRIQAYDDTGPASVRLMWNGVGNVRVPIPTGFLYPTVGPGDANPSTRAASDFEAFGMCPAPGSTDHAIGLRWQDNAFGETAYEIQRSTSASFANPTTLEAPGGTDLFVDDDAALDPNTAYFYRARPAGTDAAGGAVSGDWSAGLVSAVPSTMVGGTFTTFPTRKGLTLNGTAHTTPAGVLRLTDNMNNQNGSAFVNSPVSLIEPLRMSFDFQVSRSNGADGFAFIIQDFQPQGTGATQLNALGAPGGGLGYSGIGNSAAVYFDFHDQIDQLGVFTNGATGPGGNVAASRDNDPAAWPLAPNGTINLRLAANGNINIDGGTVFHVDVIYTPPVDPDAGDTGTLDVKITRPGAAAPAFTTQFALDLAQVIGSDCAFVGFAGATGGLNARQEIINFRTEIELPPPPVAGVFVRSPGWADAFKTYLKNQSLGDAVYGYRTDDKPATDVLPWTGLEEIVVRYNYVLTGAGIPTAANVLLDGVRSDYLVSNVTQLDPQTYVLRLERALGNQPAAPAGPGGENGDRVRLILPVVSPESGPLPYTLNVLQGDVDHSGSVLANDYSGVKARFFKNTTSPVTGTNDYSPFMDADGNGSILANDYSAVKARFFDALPPATAPSPAATPTAVVRKRDVAPAKRSPLSDLLD